MPTITTFRSPVVSLWQSAVNEVLARQAASQPAVLGDDGQAPESNLSSTTPIMLQTINAAEALLSGKEPPAVLGMPLGDCAQLYLQLIIAQARGQADRVAQLKNEIDFSTCDPLWAECLLLYEKFRFGGDQIPYKTYQQLGDYVLDLPKGTSTELRIALLADWGTGMDIARQVLADAASHQPDLLIHLGDIYYSGTSYETQAYFLDICRQTLGDRVPIYTLAGNHDMYSGGQGYYALLEQIGQPASFFCLRNDDWQLLALDTGLHDSNPGTVISNLTYLDEREAAWHRDKIANAGGRRTILLSHHQLFATSGVGADEAGRQLAVNPRLASTFADQIGQIELWLWGHEHNLIVFGEYAGLKRGRCIGSGAVPVLIAQNPYATAPNLALPAGVTQPPPIDTRVELGNNGEFYNHAYALLKLNGRGATIEYYQLGMGDTQATLLYSEQL